MTTKNINEYDEHLFRQKFERTDLYQQIEKDFDVVTFAKHWVDDVPTPTPRQWAGESIFSAVPFYYLEFLTRNKPTKIYDIGCGWNIFKKYIPNITGIGAEDPNGPDFYADIHDFVDDDFVQGHRDFFESAFSINALHFHAMSDLQKIVRDFISMLRPKGIGFLALNSQRMLELDADKFCSFTTQDLDNYVRAQLGMIDTHWLVFDVDLSVLDEGINGNIRLVMQKGGDHA